jgi:hypothetical protein
MKKECVQVNRKNALLATLTPSVNRKNALLATLTPSSIRLPAEGCVQVASFPLSRRYLPSTIF